jgi:hypothetical protein
MEIVFIYHFFKIRNKTIWFGSLTSNLIGPPTFPAGRMSGTMNVERDERKNDWDSITVSGRESHYVYSSLLRKDPMS